ncbi:MULTISPECIES: hypothetical protein [unclassified Undibacterium]|uniref:hypothetical protein n=1 Tax=unclassified Undibacterium TaxID=2630295 RepID=UPI002AC8C196|nr:MULTISPECIES: hypothetical protein [unclassified Undibacterium]MEB0138157.1 hypothetical protein [Undibacterium sp. CCC2.1]MEB0171088.1 hypothetical protein [Undibacterium sp. CCC1.1]MEB0175133.1 hypothetical protein [Undibacterium sp. CCC3.4]MEB0214283.1 hypothetical protein [Undibacterium sp. 5I2]WPX41863.1 hypothetical protein RHM61_10575 [Undibacterium sp. CCC3.4]
MRSRFCTPALLLATCLFQPCCSAEQSVSGQVRTLWNTAIENSQGPAAAADRLLPGIVDMRAATGVVEGELHVTLPGVYGIATVQADSHKYSTAWLNELVANYDAGAWQYSAGKKILSWDVGYAFRPNDVIARETRQALVSSTLIGRPLAMAEYFTAEQAVTLVWVNPGQHAAGDSNREPAVAARLYQRAGALDWYGFARYGQDSAASLGSALAWVSNEALELHASYRYLQRAELAGLDSAAPLLASSTPVNTTLQAPAQQALIGLTYTTATQHSWLLEAWWDGTAAPAAVWREWNERNRQLQAFATQRSTLSRPVAGNLAWQTGLLSASANLRRKNLLARWSWQSGAWQYAFDTLYTPEDAAHVSTASLTWQGDRWHIDAGLRHAGGPSKAILSQLPVRDNAYVAATWAF